MIAIRVLSSLLILLIAWTPIAANPGVESFEWPKAGMIEGSSVNMRAGPSTSHPVVGQFVHEYDGGELLVIGRSKGTEEHPWYRVISHKFGEGWVYGKFLFVEEPEEAVRRYALRIRADYGISPAIGVKMYGEPTSRSEEKLHIPDFNTTVHIVTLVFHGHTATYWDGTLQSVEIAGGFMDFGGILRGMKIEEAISRLGEVAERLEKSLYFATERDEIRIDFGDAGEVTGLNYRRVIYD